MAFGTVAARVARAVRERLRAANLVTLFDTSGVEAALGIRLPEEYRRTIEVGDVAFVDDAVYSM